MSIHIGSKEILDLSKVVLGGTNLISKNNVFQGSSWEENGDVIFNPTKDRIRTGFITVKPDTEYTFSFQTEKAAGVAFICATDASPKGTCILGTSWFTRPIVHFTTPENCRALVLVVGAKPGTTISPSSLINMKFEKGPIATDWSPAPEDLTRQSDFDSLAKRVSALEKQNGGAIAHLKQLYVASRLEVA